MAAKIIAYKTESKSHQYPDDDPTAALVVLQNFDFILICFDKCHWGEWWNRDWWNNREARTESNGWAVQLCLHLYAIFTITCFWWIFIWMIGSGVCFLNSSILSTSYWTHCLSEVNSDWDSTHKEYLSILFPNYWKKNLFWFAVILNRVLTFLSLPNTLLYVCCVRWGEKACSMGRAVQCAWIQTTVRWEAEWHLPNIRWDTGPGGSLLDSINVQFMTHNKVIHY